MADRVAEPGGAFVAQAAAGVGIGARPVHTATIAPMQTEVFPLALFAISGMLVFPASADLMTLFVGLEVLSLPLYLMCGLARRRRLISHKVQQSNAKHYKSDTITEIKEFEGRAPAARPGGMGGGRRLRPPMGARARARTSDA